ncbi:hypothetical protein CF548_04415 [Campylobacter jejuni]|nr:hypothetical protein [Campylobacter jejuni]EAJ0586722.1 hypothetical protein [Campylobacter jejuni]EAJ1302550.1 hypothetical protein [Campylobacter jejuni]EAJ4845078.1 hypothetical protein [Campylobacter jejuni]EAL2543913.1 hypothetical protein [Campylobacter jejuni]
MSLWNSFSYSFKEFHYLFFSVVVIFIFNIHAIRQIYFESLSYCFSYFHCASFEFEIIFFNFFKVI